MLETARLRLQPLTYDQLVKYTRCDNSLEQELHLNENARTMSPELKEAFEETILPNVADPTKDYRFSTLWTAISKAENCMVGDLCFIGEPNAAGEVEIGYGTHPAHQGRGYMTEIVAGMVLWAQAQPTVKTILAATEKTNTASFRVLEKNGFVKYDETAALFNWKLAI